MLTGRRIAAAGVVLLLAALLYALAAEARIGYDTAYQLVWGRELLDGSLPGYDVRLAPTPHPLQVLVAVPLALLGQGADEAMRALSLVSFAALAVALYRVGALLFGAPVGWLAAALVLTRPHLLELAYLADADIPAAAFAAWAAVAALRGRAGPALGLLALAGLLRPEAWVLSLAYLGWLLWRDRREALGGADGAARSACGEARPRATALAALAVAAPVLWALSDLAVTGDLLWSLHHTRTGTELLERDTGVGSAVTQLPRHLNFLLGAQVLIAALLGLVAGLLAARERMWGLVAVLVLLGGSFGVLAVAGLSLQPRYLAGLAAAVVVCAAIGGLGWTVVTSAPWRIAGIAALVLLAAGLVLDAREFTDVRGRLVDDGRQLETLARGPAGAALRDCGPVAVPTIRPIPYLALWTDTDPARLRRGAGSGAHARHADRRVGVLGRRGRRGQPPRVVVAPAAGRRDRRVGPGVGRGVGVLRDGGIEGSGSDRGA